MSSNNVSMQKDVENIPMFRNEKNKSLTKSFPMKEKMSAREAVMINKKTDF